jgi:hypothetical protein
MPARQCVFVADLAEVESAFAKPLSAYVDEFMGQRAPGDRLREFAELAFANEQQIQQLRRADRDTMVMARRLRVAGQDAHSELPSHLEDACVDYVRTRTTSQFKWFVHAFAASGRPWIQELGCGIGKEWVEEALNLLFVQRGFSSTPEEAEEYRVARETLIRLVGPFGVSESGRVVEDARTVAEDAFRWLPREDGVVHFRFAPPEALPVLGGVLAALDLSPQAFQEAGRPDVARLQEFARETCGRLKSFLQLPYARPALIAFIGT